jgi:CDP-glucose 4,6-dehydratase
MHAQRDMRAFWARRKVFLTGHTGFKGAWLSLWLDRLGAQVTGYALEPPTTPSLFELARVGDLVHDVRADVRDLPRLTEALTRAEPEIVIHMAAQALVRESYRDPVGTYATNVMGTVGVLEAARSVDSVRAVVIVTTDKCYRASDGRHGHVETDPMGGPDPYSSSKGCAELVTQAYRSAFFAGEADRAAVASARAGNVIGGGDWAPDRLVPDCLAALASGETIVLRHPDAVRPWQHVLEPLGGYLLLAERLCAEGSDYAEGWNFGPAAEDAAPVREVVQRVIDLYDPSARWQQDGGAHPHESPLLRLDCTKAAARLGWRPRTDVDQALRWAVDWHKRHAAGEDPRTLCAERIQEFMRREADSHA